jgi:hypothetical protein
MFGFAPLSAFPISAFPATGFISSGVVGTGALGTLSTQVSVNFTGVVGTGATGTLAAGPGAVVTITLAGVRGLGAIHSCFRRWSQVDTTGC